MKETLRWMPIITDIPIKNTQVDASYHNLSLWDTHPFKDKRSTLAGDPFLKDSLLSGFLFPRKSVVECWIVANRFVFLWILDFSPDRVSFRTFLLESTDLSSSVVRSLQFVFFLCPQTCPWLQQRQRRAFQVVLHEKRNASHDFLFEERTTIFSVWCWRFRFEQYLDRADSEGASSTREERM